MNKQGPGTNIDWADWSWNPITGCKHGCDYCYLKRSEKRGFYSHEPAFHPKRLHEPMKKKKSSFIFAGSAGDMWGNWVVPEWIEATLDVVWETPRHTFQFLTKNPADYGNWNFPDNAWCGTTVDGTERTERNIEHLIDSVTMGTFKFISFEPLLWNINPDLTGIDWVIIGANSNKGAKKPPKGWASQIIDQARERNIPVWMKDNYGYPEKIKERPC